MVWLAVALAVILASYTFVALRQSRRTLERSAHRSAEALAESLALAIRNVATAGSSIDELWLARWRDLARHMHESRIRGSIPPEWQSELGTPRIDWADLDGRIQASTVAQPATTLPVSLLTDSAWAALRDGAWYAEYDRGTDMPAAMVRHEERVLVLWEGTDRLSVVQEDIGAGYLIRNISDLPGLEYIVLQSTAGIELASRRVEEMSRILEDTLLSAVLQDGAVVSREWIFNDEPIIEAAARVAGQKKLLRVGVSRLSLEQLDRSVTLQLSFLGGMLFLLGLGALLLFFMSQRFSILAKDLSTAEALTEELFKGLRASLLVVDGGGIIRLANPPAAHLLGQPASALVGRAYHEVASGDPARIGPLFQQGQSSLEQEVQWQDRDGRARILLVSTTRVSEQNEDAVAIIHDVTETRRLAQQAEQSERLAALGDLAAGVAHEVRNPLNAIGIASQRLAAEFEPVTDVGEYRELLGHLRSEIDRVNVTVQEFLGLARGLNLASESVDLTALLERVGATLKLEGDKKGVRVELHLPEKVKLTGDTQALHKVFLNLGQNALHATNRDGLVAIRARMVDGRPVVSVEDNGTGISTEDLPHLFRPYFSRKRGGSGLGLALVHRIVTEHGGTIDVASEAGTGSTFTVNLPGM
jgi:PAS domain S-box-containing protein